LKTWLSSVPNIDDYEEILESEQIEKRVNDWLTGGSTNNEVGTQRGGTTSRLAELEGEISTPAKTKPASKNTFDDLDDAFADLES
jgi:hypothetical protein